MYSAEFGELIGYCRNNLKLNVMAKKVSQLLCTFVTVVLLITSLLNMSSCSPENSNTESSSSSTSEVAVTGEVDSYGCTYAVVGGYANLGLLSDGSDPIAGVELVKDVGENSIVDAVQMIASSLNGGTFTVSFTNLSPATKYKYRSFVTHGNTTYYG